MYSLGLKDKNSTRNASKTTATLAKNIISLDTSFDLSVYDKSCEWADRRNPALKYALSQFPSGSRRYSGANCRNVQKTRGFRCLNTSAEN